MSSVVRLLPGSVTAPMPPILPAPKTNECRCLPLHLQSWHPFHLHDVPTDFVSASPVAPAPVPAVHSTPLIEDEPASKKLKIEDSLTLKEVLCRNEGPVSIRVQVPSMQDKTEWKLNEQVLVFTLPLSDQCSVIQVKIHEATGTPARKQNLQDEGICIKDSNSGLLHLRQWCCRLLDPQGERWQEEIKERSVIGFLLFILICPLCPVPGPRDHLGSQTCPVHLFSSYSVWKFLDLQNFPYPLTPW